MTVTEKQNISASFSVVTLNVINLFWQKRETDRMDVKTWANYMLSPRESFKFKNTKVESEKRSAYK